ncbi:MAG: M28 family peptidase, partial [Flavobacteriaceae bacterium]|nr:M28 family peptidase [Flavobacteriaceae bacterium]
MKQFTFLMALLVAFTVSAQTDIEKVKETVSKSDIQGHIYFLADDLLKGRETGTQELKIAASYLANTFRSYGVKPNPKTGNYYQEVNFNRVSPPEKVSIKINDQAISDFAFVFPSPVKTESDAVFLNYGLEEDYANKDVEGKIIIIKAGNENAKDARASFGLRSKKQELAKKNGVMAIIELLNTDDNMWGFIDHNFNEPRLMVVEKEEEDDNDQVAHLWVLDKHAIMAQKFATAASLNTQIVIGEKQEEPVISYNVIGVVEGTDPKLKDEYIIYSAHYDHVGVGTPDETGDTIYNGARDNAVGT